MNFLKCNGCDFDHTNNVPPQYLGCCPDYNGRTFLAKSMFSELCYYQSRLIDNEHRNNTPHIPDLQPLFNYLDELGIIALQTEMLEIIEIVNTI